MLVECKDSSLLVTGIKIGQICKLVDIQYGVFYGDYYITVESEAGKKYSCHHWRFNVSKQTCIDYIRTKDLLLGKLT